MRLLQEAFGIATDGVIGPKTRAALAVTGQSKLYSKVLAARLRNLDRLITNDPEQSVSAAGRMNRMAEFVEGTV
ncbi:putative peptidoglycan-binding domain-containing protein [Nitrosomonas communis]|uniref:putative peptidoglycan-binding domain-containing protein n=1 Tax=Nitrosomonas communis TaxID=44574 RepID=UPI003D27FA10